MVSLHIGIDGAGVQVGLENLVAHCVVFLYKQEDGEENTNCALFRATSFGCFVGDGPKPTCASSTHTL